MKVYLLTVVALHVFFMLAELLPWPLPFVLRKTNEKLAPTDKLNSGQNKVVANIVRKCRHLQWHCGRWLDLRCFHGRLSSRCCASFPDRSFCRGNFWNNHFTFVAVGLTRNS